MKPFNLERALAGDPVVTRDGRKVLEIYWFKTSGVEYPVHAVITNNDCIEAYTINGEEWEEEESKIDLFMSDTEEDATEDKYEERIKSLEEKTRDLDRVLSNTVKVMDKNSDLLMANSAIHLKRIKQLEDAIANLQRPSKEPHKCPICKGTGNSKCAYQNHPDYDFLAKYESCDTCQGKGIVWEPKE